jgi:lipoprotein signal peptidase
MAKSDRWNRLLLYSLAIFGVAADQATKYGVFTWLSGVPGNRYVVFRTSPESEDALRGFALVIQFERTEDGEHRIVTDGRGRPMQHVNHGALFGFLRDHKTPANVAFGIISFAAAAAIIWWSRQPTTARDRWLCAALGLILAGTVGNLYDRIVFNGVRDFLHWDYLYNWPVFNIADCCLVTGAGLLLLQAFARPTANLAVETMDGTVTTATLPVPRDKDKILAASHSLKS